MASFNYATMQMTAKVVYYGPGLCGKTTNLQFIYDHTAGNSRGQMLSLETQTDRTLFFDLLPLEVGTIAGFMTRIQLYTVPGQVFYNTTRKLVLKGVDGVVFVADSQRPMLPANLESFKNLESNLAELGILIGAIPLVLQYNKRDLPDVCAVEELDEVLNRHGFPRLEASAIAGSGIFETLRAISKETLQALKKQLEEGIVATRASAAASRQEAATIAVKSPPAAGPSDAVPATANAPATAAPAGAPVGGMDAARLSALTTRAAGSIRAATATPAAPYHEVDEQRASLLVKLSRPDFERASRLSINLRLEDADRKAVHEVHDVSMKLDPAANPDEMLLQLRILSEEDKD